MNILEAMEKSRLTGKSITNNHARLNMKYSPQFHCMVWTLENGNFVPDYSEVTGVKRVILSPKLNEYEWELIEE
jgi:hypothetical protein